MVSQQGINLLKIAKRIFAKYDIEMDRLFVIEKVLSLVGFYENAMAGSEGFTGHQQPER